MAEGWGTDPDKAKVGKEPTVSIIGRVRLWRVGEQVPSVMDIYLKQWHFAPASREVAKSIIRQRQVTGDGC